VPRLTRGLWPSQTADPPHSRGIHGGGSGSRSDLRKKKEREEEPDVYAGLSN